ncbi:MAG: uroporphyrinogen decarboxylase family protein [Burkholderiales bacterium]
MGASESTASARYEARRRRLLDQVALKETDRTPFVFATRFWAARHAGITFEQQMYDAEKSADALERALLLLEPDGYVQSLYIYGPTLSALDYRLMQWPGHGTDPNATFQYLDREYMPAQDYDAYLFDPTGYCLRHYLPRVAGAFEGLARMPDFPSLSEWRFVGALRAFGKPELRASLQRLLEVGEHAEAAAQRAAAFARKMAALGFPSAGGGFCKAPYDHISDFLRGSKGCMLDLFRNKDKLLEAIDKVAELLLRGVVEETRAGGTPYVFIPLHWGLDGFMSPQHFQTFYWPGLRKVLLRLIEHELVPVALWEGDCTSRLEHIGDIPRGKAVYWFEKTDLVRAKAVLGDTVCLRGNVPTSMLIAGTPQEVDEYCRMLITKVGKGGGFILDGAASIPDEARTENVLAMARSVHKYAP